MRRSCRSTPSAILLAGLILLTTTRPAFTGYWHQNQAAGGAQPGTAINRDLFDRLIGDWDVEVVYVIQQEMVARRRGTPPSGAQ